MTENSSQFEGTTAGAEIDPCAAVRELGNCCRVTTCSPSADQINTACKPGSNREPIPLELRRHLVHTANQSLRGLLRVQRFTSKGADLEVKCPNYGEGTPCSTHGADLEVRCPDYVRPSAHPRGATLRGAACTPTGAAEYTPAGRRIHHTCARRGRSRKLYCKSCDGHWMGPRPHQILFTPSDFLFRILAIICITEDKQRPKSLPAIPTVKM